MCTAGWIKMPFGTEVSLSPAHIVLDGDPAPSPKGAQPPNFRSMSIVAQWLPMSAIAEHLCCVRFSFFSTVTRDCLGRTSPK